MASREEEDHNVLIDDEDIEDDDDEEDLESDFEDDDEDEDSNHQHQQLLKENALHSFPLQTISTPTPLQSSSSSLDPKRQRTTPPPITTTTTTTTIITHPSFSSSLPIPAPILEEEKKPSAFDDSRRLFQRLWTDEDEIGLLQGFLDYTSQRGGFKNSAYHHDTAPFYDQIKSRLQLDFNKNQLVEKLRRLKKKYRNVMSRINSGKDFSFKTPHDQATFEISKKIWSGIGGVGETALMDDEEGNPTEINGTDLEKKGSASSSRSRKRSRSRTAPPPPPVPPPPATGVAEENVSDPTNLLNCPVNSSLPNVIEDTVRSCLAPLFKEFMSVAINGPGNSRGFGGMVSNLLPLNLPMNFMNGEKEMMDEKWRKQQILELEVYAKRVELVQDQIKLALEELRSTESK